MKKIFVSKKLILYALCALVISISSCASAGKLQAPPMEADSAGWVVYWDWERGVREAQQQKPATLVAFAANFAEDGSVALPTELTAERLAQLPKERAYLSFVNDQHKGKQTLMKDTQVLKKLLSKKKSREQHIAEIIALCRQYNFAGVEIDYENIWRDKALMKNFAAFITELREKTQAENLKLRVVLEPKALRFGEELPGDVEYVVMFYNLYGGHSGPGPKADRRFIWHTLSQAAKLPGTPNVAFANGGFDWTAPKQAKSLTQEQAVALQKKYQVQPVRDDSSKALHFSYTNGKEQHTVWYADEQTLLYWQELAQAVGFKRISIWRFGGNGDAR